MTRSFILVLIAGLAPVGASRAQLADQLKRKNDLTVIGFAYACYDVANGKAPAKPADLGPFMENDKRLIGLLENKDIVFQFGVGIADMTDGVSNTVLAYEKDVPARGGIVLMGDGSVKSMKADEFKKAPLAKKK